MGENNDDNEEAEIEKESDRDAKRNTKEKKSVAITQTLAPMSLDLGLLTSNVNQLRYLIYTEAKDETINKINVSLVCISIALQIVVGILIATNYFNLKHPRKRDNAININMIISLISIFITLINTWVASFDQNKKAKKQ